MKKCCGSCKGWPETACGAARKCFIIDRVTIASCPACEKYQKK